MLNNETICTCNDTDALFPTSASLPLIGDTAPEFTADTTMGTINFPADYSGKWVILFSHPADFTPVCTSEIAMFATLAEDMKALNTELIGLSIDSTNSHLAWIKSIQDNIEYSAYRGQNINFPIIADTKMEIAKKYGMLQPNASDTKTVRAVFFIDPHQKIRALLYYPLSNGRNMAEIKRLLMAMQTTDKYGIATPADWQQGEDVLSPAPTTVSDMDNREQDVKNKKSGCETWYFCEHKVMNETHKGKA